MKLPLNKKILPVITAATLTGVIALGNDSSTAREMETSPQETLYDLVEPFLNERGLPKEKYFTDHAVSVYIDKGKPAGLFYSRQYRLGKISFSSQYNFSGKSLPQQGGMIGYIEIYPKFYSINKEWWIDRYRDGINGNEEKFVRPSKLPEYE